MSKDYYNILGVGKNASQDEIKKAFREKAHKFHPDKQGGDEAKFKELNEAYQVLGDQKKRSQYDQFGSSFDHQPTGGAYNGQGFGGFNINMDDLGDIFGGFGDIFGFSGNSGSGRRHSRRGSDIQIVLTVDFMESVFGVEKEISLKKTVECSRCHGEGMEPGSEIITCKTCGGKGRVIKSQRTIFGNMQVQTACEDCQGQGRIFKETCSACRGVGIVQQIANLKIKIPAGIGDNETIRLSGQGEAAPKGSQSGDLYIKIRVNSDRRFKRQGHDILSKAEINVSTAALGGKIEVQTVDGPVELKIPEGSQSGRVIRMKNKGVPHLSGRDYFGRNQEKRGDHLVEVIVKTPTGLSKKQKEMLRESGI